MKIIHQIKIKIKLFKRMKILKMKKCLKNMDLNIKDQSLLDMEIGNIKDVVQIFEIY